MLNVAFRLGIFLLYYRCNLAVKIYLTGGFLDQEVMDHATNSVDSHNLDIEKLLVLLTHSLFLPYIRCNDGER